MIVGCKVVIIFYFVNKEKYRKLVVKYKWLKEKKRFQFNCGKLLLSINKS